MTRVSLFLMGLMIAACTEPEQTAQANVPAPPKTDHLKSVKIRDVWYEMEFAGRKIGFTHGIDEKTSVNRRPAFHLSRVSQMAIDRGTETLKISSTLNSWFSPEGQPMRFVHERNEGAEKRSVEGYRDGDVMVVRKTVGRDVTERRYPITGDLRLASSLDVLLAQRLKVGTKIQGRAIDEEQADILPFTVDVRSVSADRVFTVHQTIGPLEGVLQVDESGEILALDIPKMGFKLRRVSKDQALKRSASNVDIYTESMLQMARPLPDRNDVEELVLKFRTKNGQPVAMASDGRQKVTGKGAAVTVAVRVQKAPRKARQRSTPTERWQAFLQSTDYEPLDDERLKATARRLTKDKPTVWAAARAINAFVNQHIEEKSLSRAWLSATEALASREGDCTEHAVLFSALAKIAGIPTRLVTGLAYVGGPNNKFGYHEWVEIWTGEEWLAMDPTWGQDVADATHIKLHAGLSNPQHFREGGVMTAGALGNLEVEPVSFVNGRGQRQRL